MPAVAPVDGTTTARAKHEASIKRANSAAAQPEDDRLATRSIDVGIGGKLRSPAWIELEAGLFPMAIDHNFADAKRRCRR